MLTAFHARYPDQGLLVVIDEMLEFLLARTDKQLVLDLAFLREVGEVCAQSRLRFIAGLQEALFDNPRFQFAADSVRRVKDRFSQVRIVREDVAYVVAQRLLRKEKSQMEWIRRHLAQFTNLYGEMAERLDAAPRPNSAAGAGDAGAHERRPGKSPRRLCPRLCGAT
jgi:hypothetical protein